MTNSVLRAAATVRSHGGLIRHRGAKVERSMHATPRLCGMARCGACAAFDPMPWHQSPT